MSLDASPEQVLAYMSEVLLPEQLVELRALNVPTNMGPRTFSGFFTDHEKFATAAANLSNAGASGVYFTLNPLKKTVSSAPRNVVTPASRGSLAKDIDVVRPQWLLLDIDPERPAKGASTDDEKSVAGQVAFALLSFLGKQGWPEPLLADSGNGYHLLYPLEASKKVDPGVIKRVLKALAFMFDTPEAKIDQKVYNPSRICKIYGTISRKGTGKGDRPHRMTSCKAPSGGLVELPTKLLLSMAAMLPSRGEKTGAPTGMLDNYLEEHFPGLEGPVPWGDGGRKWVFPVCPWDYTHVDRSSYVIQFPDGGIAAGCLHKRCDGTSHKGENQWKTLQKIAGTPFKDAVETTILSGSGRYRFTDLGNARRLVDSYPMEIIHNVPRRQWYVFDSKRWKPDVDGEIHRCAKAAVGIIFTEADACTDPDMAKTMRKHATRSESARALAAMVQLAGTEANVAVTPERLDRDPWLFNVQNGTLDLRTGKLASHDRTDFLTKISPVEWLDDAECPYWDAFLDYAMEGNERVIDFIHRFFGYCLTGLCSEQVLLFMEGTGQNGKSTALLILMHIMGDYAIQGAPGLLMAKKGESHPTEVADLEGVRFVANAEVEKGKPFAETLIKQLTGSDRVRARRMRQDFYEFDPTHKLIIAANHRPIIKGNDEGIWRRVLRLPWAKKIEKKDPFFIEKLKAEAPGILRRLVEGCRRWQEDGLQPPAIVTAATDEYREEMDLLAEFFEECCYLGEQYMTPKKSLYVAYSDWCEGLRQRPVGYNLFCRQLSERDFRSQPRWMQQGSAKKSVRMWLGIGLRTAGTVTSTNRLAH